MSHNNFLFVKRKFSSPGFGFPHTCEISLRLHNANKKTPRWRSVFVVVTPERTGWNYFEELIEGMYIEKVIQMPQIVSGEEKVAVDVLSSIILEMLTEEGKIQQARNDEADDDLLLAA